MTDLAEPALGGAWQDADWTKRRLRRRYRAERRFKAYGIIAVAVALAFLALLIGSVIAEGYPAFVRTSVALEVDFDADGPRRRRGAERRRAAKGGLRQAPARIRLRHVPRGDGPEGAAQAAQAREHGRPLRAAGASRRGSFHHRHDTTGLAYGVKRCRHADQGQRAPRRAGGRTPPQRPADRLDRHAGCLGLHRDRVQRARSSSTRIRGSRRSPASAARLRARSTCCW